MSKFEIFKCFRVLHPENMEVISVTKKVLKLDKSKDEILEQLRNIYDISVADDVSKFDITIEVNERQSSNILLNLTTFAPLNYDKSIFVILLQLLNIFSQVVRSLFQVSSILLEDSTKSKVFELSYSIGLLLIRIESG